MGEILAGHSEEAWRSGLGHMQANRMITGEVVTRPDECGLAALANYYYTCTLYAVQSIRLPGSQLFPKPCGVIVISSVPEDTKAKDLSVCDLTH